MNHHQKKAIISIISQFSMKNFTSSEILKKITKIIEFHINPVVYLLNKTNMLLDLPLNNTELHYPVYTKSTFWGPRTSVLTTICMKIIRKYNFGFFGFGSRNTLPSHALIRDSNLVSVLCLLIKIFRKN